MPKLTQKTWEKRVRGWAYRLMDDIDAYEEAEDVNERADAERSMKGCLKSLSRLTGVAKDNLEAAACGNIGYTYNLDWLRRLGVKLTECPEGDII